MKRVNKKDIKQVSSHSAFLQNQKAQTEISFGMIFSIILVIVFIVFAIYGVTKFLNLQKCVQTQSFFNNLQKDVDKLWYGGGSQTFNYTLPPKVGLICFKTDGNVELRDINGGLAQLSGATCVKFKKINNINTKEFCVKKINGKFTIKMTKSPTESLVTLSSK